MEGKPTFWDGYTVSDDHKVEPQRSTYKRIAWFGALHGSCQDSYPPVKGASRGIDSPTRECCIPDDSRVLRRYPSRDRRPIELATRERSL